MPHRMLRKLTQALANAAEERGTDAAGISYVRNNEVVIYKRPKPAHKLHFDPPEGTIAVMGHTRMATQGNKSQNFNNHPFLGHADMDFAFAHNGVLWNYRELRKALIKFEVPEQNIIIDKASGKDTERDGYQYLKRQILRKGDTLVIKELDRLSRNKADIKRELEEFKASGVRVKILDIPTTLTDFPPEQEWVMDMINAILIEVLGAIAENERKKYVLVSVKV